MGNQNKGDKYREIMSIGNFTKHAIENFEHNIVEQKDYLEKVKSHEAFENLK
ncbi:hypothetical protein [Clostridium saccharobutylicum]|uniref:Uncharacterized protein n=1 Tax=Clostridium saccharobutylicum DSM 13864 TaxID=1345695 RepID=U5MUI2_CLOSA|nr:hypothetical protein [Clostridium saccharobutylicum]AGX44193.1 hypothetical protein CLSA_c32270 [Clostridium saccharobutylicum DSM 13864]AQR91480.1 hypothetical protein CLOSC_32050 [Clostridium saccharobutylicum]AQS01385.1 hypothetical protein CSACC_32130 [Clostridium saccharobutylicum]AQS10992.1 hypothetical protein CLOBY_31410 [Clostridium saccharobutylicum]AQS15368.1 hypothetical protein CLOSACC_32130 [Clostridium saccharobutylicum]